MPANHPRWCPRCQAPHTGRCSQRVKDARQDHDRLRGSASQRGYDHTWSRASKAYLAAHPVCERCRDALATLVDHIVPLRAGGSRLDPANMQALDVQCHAIKTSEDRRRYSQYRGGG